MNCRPAVRAALICAIYFALTSAVELPARIFVTGSATVLAQTPGFALGLLVLCGPRYAPAVFAAQLLSSLFISHPLPETWMLVAVAAATTSIFTLAAWVVRRKFGAAPVPANFREAAALALAAAVTPLATALVTTALLQAAGLVDPGSFLKSSLVRWIGGVVGVLTLVPLIAVHVAPWVLPGRRRPRRPARFPDRIEIAAQGTALFIALWLVYVASPLRTHHAFFICFVPLFWIGLRRGLAGTTLATAVINFGSLAILRHTGAPGPIIADLFLFEIAFAAVGLGLGAAVDFRNRAEAALAESQARLARVLAGARLGMWDCDMLTGRVTYDEAWAEMAGYRLEDVPTGIGWWETQVHPEDRPRVEALLQDHLAGRTPFYEAEFRFKMRDGGWKWIYARGSVTARDASGNPLRHAGTQLDLTDRKQTEADRNRLLEIERTMLQAQKLESLGVLAGGIAHDFNNLLTVVLGNVSLAQLDLAADSPAVGYLQQTRIAAVRATELCRQMLAYAGKGQFSAALVDLGALVEDTTQLLKVSITKKCVLRFDLPRDLPPVRADATQIRQIVMNLVINASDAMGDHSGLIHVSTGLRHASAADLAETSHSSSLAPGDYVTLEVSDNGCGMTPEVKARVFEPFFTTKFAGRGLGLSAVLGIVHSHGGALRVASEPGRGSTFTLLLPAEKGAPAASPAPSPAGGEGAHGQGAILVVDDEETVRIVAARLLESHGYTTVLASDGREAVNIFAERGIGFRAVLLDLTMPHMNGDETFREIRRLRADVPVVLMSGFSERDTTERFPGRELASFIAKPFDRETLIARIREAVEKRGG